MAFYNMCQHVPLPVNPSLPSFPPGRHEPSASSTTPLESGIVRKRPLLPADKPILAPRAIQPRLVASTASYSSESGASTLLSPRSETLNARGEPPRKRGRPSKAESERRKAAAEARGEPYPLPRRSGSNKTKGPSTPASPSTTEPVNPPLAPQAITPRPPPTIPQPELRYAPPPPARPPGLIPPNDDIRARDIHSRELGPTLRELPMPAEMRQTLPSPQALQLGHRETIARMDPGERPYDLHPQERMSLVADNRRSLLLPTTARPDEPPGPAPDFVLRNPVDKRTE
ncbi:hypothetical protein ATEIFO6365_0004006100 [Aspergillus terreus]|uniref:Uncharacterized protein n=1 Tax=Aspergillus terreus TaxID=33178 RepID=A0A5M3ZEB3_ASPTE|nr:hypothetical protein ATETN484_0018007300 [Aspergillus terreus]GFF14942.1 hypothetical protein ATEIFO6365_0004006100 [Aspergillus terreus]